MGEKQKGKGLFSQKRKNTCPKELEKPKKVENDLALVEQDLAKETILIPSLAIEYWPMVDAIYKRGARSLYVYSLDREFLLDYTRKIQSTCPEMKVEYFDLEKKGQNLPRFNHVLPIIDGDCIDDEIRKYIETKKIKTLKIEQDR